MLFKLLKKDLIKNKTITITLFLFIALSSLLITSGSSMIVELTNSLTTLFTKAKTPHFVQMHSGEVNRADIDRFAATNSLVESEQTVEMLLIAGTLLNFGENNHSQNLMDNYFVTQNKEFDLLLNLKSEVIQVNEGEIAVPIYYMQKAQLAIGDTISVADKELTIIDFVRDVQMNPSIIHSKRFVVNKLDFAHLKHKGESEYLIEFRITDIEKLDAFRNAYQTAKLPNKGPSIDYNLFKTLNALTDGIIAIVIIFVSLLLTMIAVLCIRFMLMTAIEEDYQQIGVLKAIGISEQAIKKLYRYKYSVLAAIASSFGYIGSLFFNQLFTKNMLLYFGTAPKPFILKILPLLAVSFLLFIVVFFSSLTLRNFRSISAVEALQTGNRRGTKREGRFLPLYKNKSIPVSLFLCIRDVLGRFKMYSLLLLVFIICSFIIIVPVNFLQTIQSPDFIKYMGVGRSDIRIDLPQSTDKTDLQEVLTYLENDPDVKQYTAYITSQYKLINNEGAEENIAIQSGDFTIFPLAYLHGHGPQHDNEIAISYLQSQELAKRVGDEIEFVLNGKNQKLLVSGIYQDVTNGGRTAKAMIPPNLETVLWSEVSLDLQPEVTFTEKMAEYSKVFTTAKVTDLQGYLQQTFGNTIGQLKVFTIVAVAIALLVALLITSLFMKMLIAKDYTYIVIMYSIGFSIFDLRKQYILRAILVLVLGISIGTIAANTIGEQLISVFFSLLGAAEINFVIIPLKTFVLYPLLLIVIVTITSLLGIEAIKKASIADVNR